MLHVRWDNMQRASTGKGKRGIAVQSTVKRVSGPVHLVLNAIDGVQEASINSMHGSSGLVSCLKSRSITCEVHVGQM